MYTLLQMLSWLAFFIQLAFAQDNSELFSQIIGAPTASAAFDGPSASDQSVSLTICTNYIHGLIPASIQPDPSFIPQLDQMQADGVCQFCTSLGQSRVDSCCAQTSSVVCFFGDAAAQPTTTPIGPVTATAKTTAATNPTTTTGSTSTPSATNSSNGGRVEATVIYSTLMAFIMLASIGLAL